MYNEKDWNSQEHPLIKLEEDIWQLRLPLPYALDHVNVYLIQGDDGWTLVDTGLNISKARVLWEDTFSELRIGATDVEQIVVTHVHPDHFGMAGWLQEQFSTSEKQVPVYVSAEDYQRFLGLWDKVKKEKTLDAMTRFFISAGISAEYAQVVTNTTRSTGTKTSPHPLFTPIPYTGTLKMGNRNWEVIHAPGHADGQMIFYDPADRLFLSGDQLLMKITPNIGYWHDTVPGVLQRYLDSLGQLRNYDVRVGYPGHKWLIYDWQQRIAEMLAHHKERLAKTFEAVEQSAGISANGVSQAVFRLGELNAHQSTFAIAETMAHLDSLEASKKIQREEVDGVWRFSVV
ncbi:MAG: MBL fold metallo-hydrolase [Verrucomicrobia bacterium]|nr:MBL fold metallo-hydrolase [Verrucomicrobiota bacterium]